MFIRYSNKKATVYYNEFNSITTKKCHFNTMTTMVFLGASRRLKTTLYEILLNDITITITYRNISIKFSNYMISYDYNYRTSMLNVKIEETLHPFRYFYEDRYGIWKNPNILELMLTICK